MTTRLRKDCVDCVYRASWESVVGDNLASLKVYRQDRAVFYHRATIQKGPHPSNLIEALSRSQPRKTDVSYIVVKVNAATPSSDPLITFKPKNFNTGDQFETIRIGDNQRSIDKSEVDLVSAGDAIVNANWALFPRDIDPTFHIA